MEQFLPDTISFKDIIGFSRVMRETILKAELFSKYLSPVLLIGESGTGKNLFANAIHNISSKSQGLFVTINCPSLSHTLLETQLSGIDHKKINRDLGGSLFIDEVGDLSVLAQGVLLRAIQEHKLINNSELRIICSTNKDLKKLCSEKLFRWDLYYRIAGLIVELPTLKNRKQDIEPLCTHFLSLQNQQDGSKREFSIRALNLLIQYDWPGNIRELENTVESACILAPGSIIDEQIIKDLLKINIFTLKHLEEKTKKGNLYKTLTSVNGNVTKAATMLGVSRTTIYRWLNDLKGGG